MIDPTDITTDEEQAIIAARKQKRLQRTQAAYNVVMSTDPFILIILAVLVGFMWAVACITQIQTSELMILHGGKMPVQVEWGVVMQPFQLLMGTVPIHLTGAFAYAWIIQTITFIWAYALEHAVQELHKNNKHLGKWYSIISFLLISLNSYADFNNLPANDPLVQFLMAVAIGIMSVVGLPICLVLLKAGLTKLGAK